MKCGVHRIAAGPDGRCVLCRRDERARAARRLGWLSVLGLAAASAALLLMRPLRGVVVSASASRPASESQALAVEPTPAVEAERAGRPEPAPAAPEPFERAPAAPAPSELAAASAAPPAASASAAPAPDQAAVDAALRSTAIEMYATSWCGVCRRARAFLTANGLRFRERDIDRDPVARQELERRSGGTAVPVFAIDGEFLSPGFSESSLTRAMVASVERRLGVSGIHVLERAGAGRP